MSMKSRIIDLATSIAAQLNLKEKLSNKGAADGYAPLGADTKIPDIYLPDLSISETFPVADMAAMILDLPNTQTGDAYVLADTGSVYMRNSGTAGTIADVLLINTDVAGLISDDALLTDDSTVQAVSERALKVFMAANIADDFDHDYTTAFTAALT